MSAPRTRAKRTTKAAAATDDSSAATAAEVAEPTEAPKKSKKKFPVVAVVTPDGIEGTLLPTRRPLIVHLPLQSRDVPLNDMPILYDPAPPAEAQPYDYRDPFTDTFGLTLPPAEEKEEGEAKKVAAAPPAPEPVAPAPKKKEEAVDYYALKGTLLTQFQDSSEIKQIPMQSSAACFWCCHTFTHRPVVLPIRDTGEHLIVTGNFCSPECATAHLFEMRQDSHTRWEQLALLYRVYGEACQGVIHPAPSRSVLTLFGGTMSIEEYRSMLLSRTVRVDVHLPPMVSILATMDTKPIDFYDSNLTKTVNETVKERLQKAEEGLRLRRTKPLKAWESTLDACLNLRVRTEI
jgi:hypothetical protein